VGGLAPAGHTTITQRTWSASRIGRVRPGPAISIAFKVRSLLLPNVSSMYINMLCCNYAAQACMWLVLGSSFQVTFKSPGQPLKKFLKSPTFVPGDIDIV
jgi:hypothetical protein